MKEASPERLLTILRLLNWDGHVELGDKDLRWLAQEITLALSPKGDTDLCEMCDSVKPIVLKTMLGRICEDCLNTLCEEAEEVREQWEED